MEVGSKIKVKNPKDEFAGYVGEVIAIAPSPPPSKRVWYWCIFPGHRWQMDRRPFSFEAHELEEQSDAT